jgi:tRNA U55 pseudouridine synthase TruB
MQRYALIEKNVGVTPLQAIETFRKEKPELKDLPLTYAGRLDPMAGGKLLVLIGDECKRREKYDGLDKEYEFEVLLGFASDSGDVLGLPAAFQKNRVPRK